MPDGGFSGTPAAGRRTFRPTRVSLAKRPSDGVSPDAGVGSSLAAAVLCMRVALVDVRDPLVPPGGLLKSGTGVGGGPVNRRGKPGEADLALVLLRFALPGILFRVAGGTPRRGVRWGFAGLAGRGVIGRAGGRRWGFWWMRWSLPLLPENFATRYLTHLTHPPPAHPNIPNFLGFDKGLVFLGPAGGGR